MTVNHMPSRDRASYSRFWQRLQRRYADLAPCLPAGELNPASFKTALAALQTQWPALSELGAALRVLRQLVMLRLMDADCDHGASLEFVTLSMTRLAEFALAEACAQAEKELDALHGPPWVPSGTGETTGGAGRRAQIWIVGMGKLGARELNVSSDIDLVYVYDHDGETLGRSGASPASQHLSRITHQEYFARLVKRVYQLIGEPTDHGSVFRVELALRPNGNSGPAAISLNALETYFQQQGREWERFAWLKSRVIVPATLSADSAAALRGVVLPFVFRRYLDYGVFEALRRLHQQIRDHALRRSAGQADRLNDIKLSRGGIREIEFTVQLLQVVRGGQFPELRCRPTLEALERLAKANLMPQATAQALAQAYRFLRRLEHRIQYLDDQQTHLLPTQAQDLSWLANTLDLPDTQALLATLAQHRDTVAHEFEALLGTRASASISGATPALATSAATPKAPSEWEELRPQLTEGMAQRVQLWQNQGRLQALRETARLRLFQLLQRTAQWVRQGEVQAEAAATLVDWLESLLRRESYLALLWERPAVHTRLLHLLGAARWPARYLLKHPGVIDELATQTMLQERFSAPEFEGELARRRASLQTTGEDDEEALLNLLRRAHHAEVFRTLARDVGGHLSVEQVADDLSALADSVLRVALEWCWQRLKNRHETPQDQPQIGIIAYGKLGGKELGYGSDLDVVFVFEDEHERAPEVYAALVRKLITWLTAKTGEGDLYEIDTALRPNGNSGLLVSSMAAYSNYQQQRGSNTAWTWEHQAITRARCAVGSAALRQGFEAVREAVITAPRDPQALRAEIMQMREKVRLAHPVPPDQFDIKHSPGGMVDAEFAVQYLVLTGAAREPLLRGNWGNIQLLENAEKIGLLPVPLGADAAKAYRQLRARQHQARLNEAPTHLPAPEAGTERDAILRLWHQVFGDQEAAGTN